MENGSHIKVLLDNDSNGTFSKTIEMDLACKAITTHEAGTWTFDGKRYAEVTSTVDLDNVNQLDPAYSDSFGFSGLDDDHATLLDSKTGIDWLFQNVADGFQIPPSTSCAV